MLELYRLQARILAARVDITAPMWRVAALLLITTLAGFVGAESAARGERPSVTATTGTIADSLTGFTEFQAAVRSLIAAHWRQSPPFWQNRNQPPYWLHIEPSVYHFLVEHAEHVRRLSAAQQEEFVISLTEFILAKRREMGSSVVIGPERKIIGLLDPHEAGLRRGQIEGVAAAYDAPAQVFQGSFNGATKADAADGFLQAVQSAAAADTPATVVILAHGLRNRIAHYGIRHQDLAAALLAGARRRAGDRPSLGHLVLVFDACYSADLVLNLCRSLEQKAAEAGVKFDTLPLMISSVNRQRVGFAQSGERFVPRFWGGAVVELFYKQKPAAKQSVTLADFMHRVDANLYGYGRKEVWDGATLIDYKIVAPELIQDPVYFVPIKPEEVEDLRKQLRLPDSESLPSFLDIGAATARETFAA